MKYRWRAPNVPLLIIAFLTSLTLWVIVRAQSMDEKETTMEVPLTYKNLDSRYVITEIDPTIPVKIEGPGDRLTDPALKSAQAVVDLTNAVKGTKSYTAIISTRDPEVRRFFPQDHTPVKVTIELLTSKSVPVSVVLRGRLSDPTIRFDNSTIVPDQVTFTGRQSRIDEIVSARVSLDLRTIDINHAHDLMPLSVTPYDSSNHEIQGVSAQPQTVSVAVSTAPASVEKELFVAPIFTGSVAPGFEVSQYRTFPDKVTVSGSSSTLAELTNIKTRPINVTGLKASGHFFAELDPPNEVKLKNPKPIRVMLELQRQTVPAPSKTKPKVDGNAFPETVPPLTPIKGSGRK